MKTKEVKKRIASFEEALKVTGRPQLPDFSNLPADLREYFEAQYMAIVITEALNEGWTPDWTNQNQQKWIPWFHRQVSSSGFVFYDSFYSSSFAHAGRGSRLCFKDEATARYAGKQFIEIWNKLLLK
jgi:hypothetical protein